jgi:hypothetical protein
MTSWTTKALFHGKLHLSRRTNNWTPIPIDQPNSKLQRVQDKEARQNRIYATQLTHHSRTNKADSKSG